MVQSKPIISQVLRSLRVQPGMTYALVLDIEQKLWMVESCPAGTHFWTLDQAAELPKGPRTHRALQEIITLGRETQQIRLAQHAAHVRMRAIAPLRASREVPSERRTPLSKRVESIRPLCSSRSFVEA